MHKSLTNTQLSQLLRSVAAALTLKSGDNRFRIIAYEKAADAIEHASSEVKDLWDEGKLGDLPGIGSSIAAHLDELFTHGKSRHFDQILHGISPATFELMKVPGIGPKSAHKLSQILGITKAHGAIEKLEKAAQKGKIQNIEGFGIDSQSAILEGITQYKNRSNRVLLPVAAAVADEIIAYLNKNQHVKDAKPLGSLRRQAATVGDIDIAVASDQAESVIEHFIHYPKHVRVIESGPQSASITVVGGLQIDIMVQPPGKFGALLQHFTGSKHHNIALRELALKKGLSLSEKGIKDNGRLHEFATEEEFYKFLGLDWIPPELREDTGEIQAAQKHTLPQLIKFPDIKGDLHLHSDFPIEPSHDLGNHPFADYVEKALQRGYEYIGFAEHNPSFSMHTVQQMIDLTKTKQEAIEKINYSYLKRGIKILNGMEIDIRANGELALPNKAFEYLDYAIASIHGSFRGSAKDQTARVLRALEHPKVRIFGHPTARKLGEREGVDLDWEQIFEFCLAHHKFLEINSYPDRLDLPDNLARDAIRQGLKLVIDTDSHSTDTIGLITFGVSVARRAWATPGDIINTLPQSQFLNKFLPQ